MSKLYDNIDKLIEDVNEDEIIKEIMLEYPELYEQLNFNEYTIKERLENNAYLQEMWRMLYIKEKSLLERVRLLKDEYIGKLYEELKFHNDKKLLKTEIENYFIPKDKKAIKFRKLEMKQDTRVQVFQSIWESFKSQAFTMREFLKNMEN
jgi:hypothetical protein